MQLPTQYQQILPLFASFTDAQQVIPTQLVNPFAVIADFADRAALLCRDIGNAHCRVGNGLDCADDLVQRTVRRLRLIGRGSPTAHREAETAKAHRG